MTNNPEYPRMVSGHIDASPQWAAEVLGVSPEPRCPNSYDIHCSHWYDGATCCRCAQRPENTAGPA